MDCPYIPELSASQFGQALQKRMQGGRHPISGSFELTARCNVRCQHCYVSEGPTGLPGKQELTTAEAKRVLDELADAGVLWLLLTGGEPLLRGDFREIYTYAKQKGFLLYLFTNGTLLTPKMADFLAEWPPFSVEITLYGYTQDTYERVTGVRGSHARCMRGIELVLERKLPLKLKTMVMTLNKHELDDMRAYASRLGVEFRYDAMLNDALPSGCGRPVDVRLSPEEVVQIDLADEERLASWQEFLGRYGFVYPDPSRLFNCGAGRTNFHVDSFGMLYPCIMSRWQGYDLRQGSMAEGWREMGRIVEQPSAAERSCATCDLANLCGTCPGWSYLAHGDPQQRVEFQCQVAHLRAREFGFIPLEQVSQVEIQAV